jgi:hypothetical protein
VNGTEKFFLRSPEVIVGVLLHCTLPLDFDLSDPVSDKLVDKLLSQLKSNNSSVREDAFVLLKTIFSKIQDVKTQSNMVQIVCNAITSKSPTPEQRIQFYESLKALKPSTELSSQIQSAASKLMVRESSDQALEALVGSIAHLSVGSDSTLGQAAVEILMTGLKDSKANIRLLYLNVLNDLTKAGVQLGAKTDGFTDLVRAIVKKVHESSISLLDPKKETPIFMEEINGLVILFHLVKGMWELYERI